MEQVVKIIFPVPLSIKVHRENCTNQFFRQSRIIQFLVHFKAAFRDFPKIFQNFVGLFLGHLTRPPLLVEGTLKLNMFRIRIIEFIPRFRITEGIFINVGCPVAYPLPCHEDGHLSMKLELYHFERGGVAVTHEVTDQPPVLGHFAGALTIAHPCRLDDGIVSAHGINQSDKTLIQTGNSTFRHLLLFRHSYSPNELVH